MWTPGVVLAATAEMGLEGIVCKHLDPAYLPGRRSPDWITTPHRLRKRVRHWRMAPRHRRRPPHSRSSIAGRLLRRWPLKVLRGSRHGHDRPASRDPHGTVDGAQSENLA